MGNVVYTLGLLCYGGHDSAAVLVADGKVVAAAEEERFSRRKFDPNFSAMAIEKFVDLFGPPLSHSDGEIPQHYRDIAASLQVQLERTIAHMVKEIVKLTGNRNLCLAGGVALNSAANGQLIAQGHVDAPYVPPAADAGVALGVAYLAQIRIKGHLSWQVLDTALLGPDYDDEQILQAVQQRSLCGTGRVQTVSQASHPLYWKLIHTFYQKTGVPVVLNTSFNVKGQPIVNTPVEAIDTFLNTEMDALVCGNYLVMKE